MGVLHFWWRCLLRAFKPTFDTADIILLLVPAIASGVAAMLGYSVSINLEWWVVILSLFGALLLMRWVLVAPYELYRDERRQRVSLQSNLAPAPNWSMQDAFQHVMIYSKLAIGTNPDDDNFYTDVEGNLRDAARIGQIKVWAREANTPRGGFRQTLIGLSPDVWDHFHISLPTCIYDQAESARIIDCRTNPWTEYEDTRVTKAQILSVWPGASWWERWCDPQHKRRLAFFQEERLRAQG